METVYASLNDLQIARKLEKATEKAKSWILWKTICFRRDTQNSITNCDPPKRIVSQNANWLYELLDWNHITVKQCLIIKCVSFELTFEQEGEYQTDTARG